MPRYGDDERVIFVNSGSGNGGRDIFDQFVAELVRKALESKGKKDKDHDDDELKGFKKFRKKPIDKTTVTCWTLLLMAASPWIGLKVLQMYASLLGQYAVVLQQFVK